VSDGPGHPVARFVPLRAVSALAPLAERSRDEPVIIFQHDPSCPISRKAQRKLAGIPIEVALVDVAQDRPVSRSIEQRTGVPRESPQVLVVRAGRVVWTASHFAITRAAVTHALRRAALDSSPEPPEPAFGTPAAHLGVVTRLRPRGTASDCPRRSPSRSRWSSSSCSCSALGSADAEAGTSRE
jgi:bacillithiol system protein YtxJ